MPEVNAAEILVISMKKGVNYRGSKEIFQSIIRDYFDSYYRRNLFCLNDL